MELKIISCYKFCQKRDVLDMGWVRDDSQVQIDRTVLYRQYNRRLVIGLNLKKQVMCRCNLSFLAKTKIQPL